jgi:D-glycero-D-manno-heptose 1,7-bisphosphate phosphatase
LKVPGVFLDRDGVLVALVWDEDDAAFEAPSRPDDVTLLPGAAEAIASLRAAGYTTVVVSNQPAAAKRKASRADLDEVHARVVTLLAEAGTRIDDYRYCLHHPQGLDPDLTERCGCRKPEPGMLVSAAAARGIDLPSSWMIGDADRDVEAGRRVGCKTILIANPHSRHRRSDGHADYCVATISEAAAIVISGALTC